MPNLKMQLAFATLIPDFIYQFLSNEYIKQEHMTCMELEDVREAVAGAESSGLDEIKDFLSTETVPDKDFAINSDDEAEEKLEKMSDVLDEELAEVDGEYYHSYTPGELKFIFEQIIENIDEIYGLYYDLAGINMALTIGFVTEKGLEANMVIEFLDIEGKPEYLEDIFFVPMGNYMVSDSKLARVYFRPDPAKIQEAAGQLDEIIGLLKLKPQEH